MGWHDAGDGTLFCGINVEQGRIIDYATPGQPQFRSFIKAAIKELNVDLILSPTQSLVLRKIKPQDKPRFQELMRQYDVPSIDEIDPLTRLAMACPALPLCGLAVTEAERYMPTMVKRIRALLDATGLHGEEIMMRMTGEKQE